MLIFSLSGMYVLRTQHLLISSGISCNLLGTSGTIYCNRAERKLVFFHFKRKTIQILCCHWFYKTGKTIHSIELHHILERVCTEKGEVLNKRMSLIRCQRSHDVCKEETTLPFWGSHTHSISMHSLNKAYW